MPTAKYSIPLRVGDWKGKLKSCSPGAPWRMMDWFCGRRASAQITQLPIVRKDDRHAEHERDVLVESDVRPSVQPARRLGVLRDVLVACDVSAARKLIEIAVGFPQDLAALPRLLETEGQVKVEFVVVVESVRHARDLGGLVEDGRFGDLAGLFGQGEMRRKSERSERDGGPGTGSDSRQNKVSHAERDSVGRFRPS